MSGLEISSNVTLPLDEQLHLQIAAVNPEASISRHMVREWKESYSFVGEQQEQRQPEVHRSGICRRRKWDPA